MKSLSKIFMYVEKTREGFEDRIPRFYLRK